MIAKRTRILIDEMLCYNVLGRVGEPVSEEYCHAASWEKAVKSAESRKWLDFTSSLSNRIHVRCKETEISSDRKWIHIMSEVRPLLEPVFCKINVYFGERNAAWGLGGAIGAHLCNAIGEMEYSDLFTPMFFLPLVLPVYKSGHYACGWEGKYFKSEKEKFGHIDSLPPGRLIIF